jgi:hypothetical protein
MRQATITINGRLYDALSGQPLQKSKTATKVATAVAPPPTGQVNDIARTRPARTLHEPPAHAIHGKPQKATTLNRQALKRPENATKALPMGTTTHQRSPLINRFGPAVVNPIPQAYQSKAAQPKATVHPNTTPLHPSVMAAMQQRAAGSEQPKNSKELKEMLIRERLAQVGNEPAKKTNIFARRPRLASILVSSLSLLILGGYFTYINLANISMRVAANNAGINASFPGYKPDGYNVNGPITYAPGEVTISYKSNTDNSNFALTQKTSNWDSQGVLDNYVRKQTSTYLTFQQRGVTVYTFNNKAAWTNGGLLYTIDGEANLSSDQILKLATSL